MIVAENEALRSKSEGFLLRNRGIHHIGVFKPIKEFQEGKWYYCRSTCCRGGQTADSESTATGYMKRRKGETLYTDYTFL